MDTMAELVELVGIMGWRREQGKDHRERGKSKGMLMGYSPHPVMMVETGSCAQPYTVYGGKAKRGQASE
jgi:hypothetical protein